MNKHFYPQMQIVMLAIILFNQTKDQTFKWFALVFVGMACVEAYKALHIWLNKRKKK